MRIHYETKTYSCPVCGEMIHYVNTLEYLLVGILTLPFSLPGIFAYHILNDYIFKDSVPCVKPPSFFICKMCGKKLKVPGFYLKSELSRRELLAFSFRWWFRLCYALSVVSFWGIICAICILASDNMKSGDLMWMVLLTIIPLVLIAIIALVYKRKKDVAMKGE